MVHAYHILSSLVNNHSGNRDQHVDSHDESRSAGMQELWGKSKRKELHELSTKWLIDSSCHCHWVVGDSFRRIPIKRVAQPWEYSSTKSTKTDFTYWNASKHPPNPQCLTREFNGALFIANLLGLIKLAIVANTLMSSQKFSSSFMRYLH